MLKRTPDWRQAVAERVGDGLVRVGAMTPEQVQKVLAAQKAGDKRPFGEVAVSLGFVGAQALEKYLASVRGAT
jgi:hypothetical protein